MVGLTFNELVGTHFCTPLCTFTLVRACMDDGVRHCPAPARFSPGNEDQWEEQWKPAQIQVLSPCLRPKLYRSPCAALCKHLIKGFCATHAQAPRLSSWAQPSNALPEIKPPSPLYTFSTPSQTTERKCRAHISSLSSNSRLVRLFFHVALQRLWIRILFHKLLLQKSDNGKTELYHAFKRYFGS